MSVKQITNMSDTRKNKVRLILESSRSKDSKYVARKLKEAAGTQSDSDRDWERIARTEMTNLNALNSLVGLDENAVVYRPSASDCCEICEKHFGPSHKPKYYKVKNIPPEISGALHVSCRCRPWEKRIQKSIPDAEIKTTLANIPFVIEGYNSGYTILSHGFSRAKRKNYEIVDAKKCGNAMFYPASFIGLDIFDLNINKMKNKKTWDDYLTYMCGVLPAVSEMPEVKTKNICDMMGYKTLTDWYILVPGKIVKDAVTSDLKRTIRAILWQKN